MSTQKVAEFVTATSVDNLPREVVARAKITIKDHICVMLAAHRDKAVLAASDMAVAMGGRPEATLVEMDVKTTLTCPRKGVMSSLALFDTRPLLRAV